MKIQILCHCFQSRYNAYFDMIAKYSEVVTDRLKLLFYPAVRLGPQITDTVKGKLRLGAKSLQVGGVEKKFMELFSVKEGEKLLKASQCYLSTTSGPISGLLFISTHKVAFCSEKSIKISSPKGELSRVRYKVIFLLKCSC